jgi:hypothetical protein
MLGDLADCCRQVRSARVAPVPEDVAALLGSFTVEQVTPQALAALLAAAGLDGGELVLDARVSAMLERLDPQVRGALALLVADGIFTPTRRGGAH